MNKYLLFVLTLGFFQQTSAQTPDTPSRWSIDLTAGPAIPVGTFRDIHSSYSSNGVSTGGGMELAAEYRLCAHFGGILTFSGQFNPGNGAPSGLSSEYIADGQGYHPHLHRDWKLGRIQAGGVYTLPLTKRSGPALLFRALAGIQRTRIPDDSFIEPGSTQQVDVPGSAMPWAFSYEGDAGIKWNFPGRVALVAYAGYNGSRPAEKETGPLNYGPNIPFGSQGEVYHPQKISVPTGSLLFRAGIDYKL